jgi:hypothetical protein
MPETFLYLNTIGRKTGQAHQIEIWFVEHEGCYFLCSELRKKADWIQNSLKTPQVSFYLAERGQDLPAQSGRVMMVEDAAIIAILKQKFDAKYNWSKGLFLKICPD